MVAVGSSLHVESKVASLVFHALVAIRPHTELQGNGIHGTLGEFIYNYPN